MDGEDTRLDRPSASFEFPKKVKRHFKRNLNIAKKIDLLHEFNLRCL